MSSTILTPASTPTPDQQAPTTSSINLSDIPGHMEHAWEDVKNLFETGDTTGHPEATERAATQERENQEIQNQGEADYKNYVYKNSPDEFKKAHPAEYLYRKAYDTAHQAITEPAEHMLTGKAREEIAPKIDELTEAGLGAAGINKPGASEPVIDTSVIPNPESGIEESLENYHGDRINRAGAPTPKPTPKPAGTPVPRVDLSDIPGVKTVQHPVEITTHGPSWDRTHRMNVNGERAGSIGYHVDPDGTARIYGAHVPEHMRGQGIGQEGYKSIFKATEADPTIKRIQSDPTHISPAATHTWEAMQRKGEYPIENITHANGQPGFQIDFKKDIPNGKAPADSMGQKAASLPDSAASGPTKTNPNIKPSAVVDPKIQKTVEDAGGVYRGQNKDGLVEITLPESVTKNLPISDVLKKHVSVNLHANEVTPEAVKGAIDRKLTEYGGKTAPNPEIKIAHGSPDEFAEAVKNTPEAKLDGKNLTIHVERFQKPEQAGERSVRTGVFYSPEKNSPYSRYYKTGKVGYGGTQKVEGDLTLKNPIVAKGASGGKVPARAYDAIKGKGAYEEMRSDVLDAIGATGLGWLSPVEQRQRIADVLEKYGGDPSLAPYIVEHSKEGNTLPYAIQEHIAASAVREAGHDGIVGYNKIKGGYRLSEVFHVDKKTYPMGLAGKGLLSLTGLVSGAEMMHQHGKETSKPAGAGTLASKALAKD